MTDPEYPLPEPGYWVEINERVGEEDSDMHKRLGPYRSRRVAEKAEDGVNRNLNHDRFWTDVVKGYEVPCA